MGTHRLTPFHHGPPPQLYATPVAGGTAGTETVALTLEKMHCAACTITARQALMNVAGVLDTQVTFEPPEAIVIYDPTRVSVQDLTDATAGAGYPSSIK